MSEFKRSPSKVWWASESVEWREISESPGSQDSGFSDTETSPPVENNVTNNNNSTPQRIAQNLIKSPSSKEKPQNLSANYKEKATPEKSIKAHFNSPGTPSQRVHFTKNSPRVNRNLFNTRQKESVNGNQYAKDISKNTITHSNVSSETTSNDSCSCSLAISDTPKSSRSLPLPKVNIVGSPVLNKSAPAWLQSEDEEVSFNGNHSLSSDCESELECLFNGPLDSPKHTSTPKTEVGDKMRNKKGKVPLNLYLKFQHEKRVPPIISELTDNDAVKKWLDEERQICEKECMTTLQCKSIAAELNQKVSHTASNITLILRNILSHSQRIQIEYKKLNSEKTHVAPLAQSLAGNIMEFLQRFTEITPTINQQYDDIRKADYQNALKLVVQLFNYWQTAYLECLLEEVKKLISKLENPKSELELRAAITGITSISLRNEELIETFIKLDIVPILLILCEKCEGSSVRSILLRCLSTMCCNTFAVRQFEKYSGIQLVSDTLEEDSRPEPERSEAVALLAQVTAPWIEDNNCIRGLPDYSRKLVRSLTKFTASTKCCQNLLLCAAALANLSTMDNKSIKYMLHLDTVKVLLNALNKKTSHASVYFLEQIATLMANMTAFEIARKQLVEIQAPAALLRFLNVNSFEEEVAKRLQQKAIIALSRLCGNRDAADQIVNLGGVEKLVKMCRDRYARFDNDAVLVATLATLRKIADACGYHVISAEDAQELIEPKLLDSFLAYSTQSESYV